MHVGTNVEEAGAKLAGNFSQLVSIYDGDFEFIVGRNGVLRPTESGLESRMKTMISSSRSVVAFKLVQLFMFFVVIAQACEISSLAGIRVYQGDKYWASFWNACAHVSLGKWTSGSIIKSILELL